MISKSINVILNLMCWFSIPIHVLLFQSHFQPNTSYTDMAYLSFWFLIYFYFYSFKGQKLVKNDVPSHKPKEVPKATHPKWQNQDKEFKSNIGVKQLKIWGAQLINVWYQNYKNHESNQLGLHDGQPKIILEGAPFVSSWGVLADSLCHTAMQKSDNISIPMP